MSTAAARNEGVLPLTSRTSHSVCTFVMFYKSNRNEYSAQIYKNCCYTCTVDQDPMIQSDPENIRLLNVSHGFSSLSMRIDQSVPLALDP